MAQMVEQYVLGIDGGGTKTIARLVNLQNNKTWQAQGGASSLTNDFNGAVDTIANLCRDVIQQANTDKSLCQYQQISAVFGLAGAGNDDRVQKLIDSLAMNFAHLAICSDARTSAYGANNGKPVAVIALGTGSVGMCLDAEGNSTFKGGWGFIAGDEGSGAKLGLAAVKLTLFEFEHQGIESELAKRISLIIGSTRTDMLTWLSSAKPIDFAQFAPLVFQINCPQSQQLIANHISEVNNLIKLTLANTQLPLVLLGGLAADTQTLIAPEYQQQLIAAKGNALDGACFLAEQFYLT